MSDMAQDYEYVAVELPSTPWKTRDRDVTTKLNEVAEHGWRLVGIQPAYDVTSKSYAYFERKVDSDAN